MGSKGTEASFFQVYISKDTFFNKNLDNFLSYGEYAFLAGNVISTTSYYPMTSKTTTFLATTPYTATPDTSQTTADSPRTETVVSISNVHERDNPVYYETDPGPDFNFTLDIPCSIDGTVPITHVLGNYNNESSPSWAKFDDVLGTLSGTVPALTKDTNFTFQIDSSWSVFPTGSHTQLVIIGGKVNGRNKTEIQTATTVAVVTTQVTVGVGLVAVTVSFIMDQSNLAPLWAILQQIQIVILLLLIDDYI